MKREYIKPTTNEISVQSVKMMAYSLQSAWLGAKENEDDYWYDEEFEDPWDSLADSR